MSGLGAAGVSLRGPDDWRGRRLGLPAAGAGSVAGFNARLLGVLVDLIVAGLMGGLVNGALRSPSLATRQGAGIAALLLLYAVLLPTTGQTFGMRLAHLRVHRTDGRRLSLVQALVRGFLVVLTLPALFTDRDGRGLHDRAVGSLIVRTR